MKMKTNLYFLIIFITAINIITHSFSKNVLLLSNLTTSNSKKCFLKNLIQSFKLKKLEKSVLPIENISEGKIGENNILFFDVSSLNNNHTENSILLQELQSNLILHYNTTILDSILLFYALNDKLPTIENDINTLITNFGENILKTTAIVAINQRRLLNNKKTFLDIITDKHHLSYIHISTLCEDRLDKDIIVKDLNFVFAKTISYDMNENRNSIEEKKSNSLYFIVVMTILSLIIYSRRFWKIKEIKVDKNEQNLEKITKDVEIKEKKLTKNTKQDITHNFQENVRISQIFEGKTDNGEKHDREEQSVNSNEDVESQLSKGKINKEVAEIFQNLQIELFEEEEQKEENSLSLTPSKQDYIKLKEPHADKELMHEPDMEKLDFINLSDSEEKFEIETNAKLIEGAKGERDLRTPKNHWEFLN